MLKYQNIRVRFVSKSRKFVNPTLKYRRNFDITCPTPSVESTMDLLSSKASRFYICAVAKIGQNLVDETAAVIYVNLILF